MAQKRVFLALPLQASELQVVSLPALHGSGLNMLQFHKHLLNALPMPLYQFDLYLELRFSG
jgi:hypothetical protein